MIHQVFFIFRLSYVSNPINTFGLFKRTYYDYEHVWKTVLGREWPEAVASQVKAARTIAEENFPDVADYSAACDSLVLLQEAYDFNTDDLANGIVVNFDGDDAVPYFKSDHLFTWSDYNHIGTRAADWVRQKLEQSQSFTTHLLSLSQGWLDLAYEWLKMGMDKCLENTACQNDPLFEEMKANYNK